jgi:hypothetical protein
MLSTVKFLAWWAGLSPAWDVCSLDPDAVEPIRHVDLSQMHWTIARIGVYQSSETMFQGPAKLHGFARFPGKGVVVQTLEGVLVDNQPWAPVALRHDAERRDANVF